MLHTSDSGAAEVKGNRNTEPFLAPKFADNTKRKIRAILAIGLEHGHDSLVLSAFGCGAFCASLSPLSALFISVGQTVPWFFFFSLFIYFFLIFLVCPLWDRQPTGAHGTTLSGGYHPGILGLLQAHHICHIRYINKHQHTLLQQNSSLAPDTQAHMLSML